MNVTQDTPEAVWKLIQKIGTAMLVSHARDNLDARPLQAYANPEAHRIFFMTDSPRLLSQLQGDGRVMLTFAGKTGNDYVALTGSAVVIDDRVKIRDLWAVWAKAFWEGPEDPDIRVISVTPEHARYWDGINPAFSAVAMIKGVLTSKQPDLGTSGETAL